MASFSVVAIVREPADIIRRFLRWYLAEGAASVTLFFDDPADPAMAVAAEFTNVVAIPCDADFWRGIGIKPDARFTRRQNTALTRAYYRQTADWMLNVDADELMHFPGETIAGRIGRLPLDARCVSIRTAEHVLVPDREGMHFRTAIEKPLVREIYGADADLFVRRGGLVGHPEGKSFIRTGQKNIRLRQHWAETDGGDKIEGPVLTASDNAFLLHLMVEGFASWRGKLDWRVNSWGYPQPIKERVAAIRATAASPERDLQALYRLLHELPPERFDRLVKANGIFRFDLE